MIELVGDGLKEQDISVDEGTSETFATKARRTHRVKILPMSCTVCKAEPQWSMAGWKAKTPREI